MMAHGLCQPIAAAVGAKLARRLSAGGQDDGVGPIFAAVGTAEGKARALPGKPCGCSAAFHPDAPALHGQLQHRQHRGGLTAAGIDPALVLLRAPEPQPPEKRQHALRRHARKDLRQRFRRRGLILRRRRPEIGEVAAAVAGGQKLLSRGRQPLQHPYLRPGRLLRRSDGRRHAGSAAAYDHDPFHMPASLPCLQKLYAPGGPLSMRRIQVNSL